MPELPDVAVFQRYADSTSLHQKIDRSEVTDSGVLKNPLTVRELSSALQGAEFASTRRHGKHLFVELSGKRLSHSRRWLELHFGMTGELKYYKHEEERPRYARVVFHFENGFQLAYVSRRKLGHVSLIGDPHEHVAELGLGPDALEHGRDFGIFRNAMSGNRGTIKAALMSQDKLAGIGNVYSDEILFHARIHPQSAVAGLDEKHLKSLHRCTVKVLETAIERKVDVNQMPRTWLLPHRGGGPCPRCGTELKTKKISGRTSHFCKACQEKIT